ncbi:methylcobalamin:coenzyme M methyltransferase [Anaerohalosphaera lusitana]|uniref:Methylcobalamin:coenzyme M methyltransferase n=1 Tax=Anaerohalosphaera lusitana TaxID=1936003 RepID=A0A1U9NMU5_9BACT|nr:uroporphyrinogen decarboxylase family protein [Anaerohalosphaera lusitana]AQT69048.1 methylcobalamin:coenzyme M methyltransferase [Anaerohalosphaera lusitana]
MVNHRELVRKSLDHVDPGKVVVDFGSTPVTGMHVLCVARLREHYGLEKKPVKVSDPYQMLGEIEPDLLDAMGVDTIGLAPPATMFGFKNNNWKEFTTPWGQEVLVGGDFNVTKDSNGDLLMYPQGDTDSMPSGRMPASGYFFDTIIRQEPIDEDKLDPADNLEEFGPISDEDLNYYKKQAGKLADSGRAVVSSLGGTAFGDIALVPAPFLKNPKGIRDITEWYMSTAMRPDYIHAIFSKQSEIAIDNLARLHDAVGEAIDVLLICGTDFGTQTSSFCSTETFDKLYAPYYKKLNNWIHANTTWKTFKHSCGAVANFMEHFIECGFDIINPVQCSAAGMDPKTLKESYGDRIVFWGGGVDTQKTLPFQTPEDVRQEVLSRCETFAPGGGFVFDAIHNVQANAPVENVVAMIEAVKEFNGEG